MLYRLLLLWLMSFHLYALEFLPKDIIAHIFYYQGQEDEQQINLFFIDKYMNSMINDDIFISIILYKFNDVRQYDDIKKYMLLCEHIIKLFYTNNKNKFQDSIASTISFALIGNKFIHMVERLLSFIDIKEIEPLIDAESLCKNYIVDMCSNGLINMVKLFDYKFESENSDWQYLFSLSCRNGHLDLAKYLLTTKKINVNYVFFDHTTSLYWACKNGHSHIVEFLLAHDAGLVDNDPYLPIHVSAYYIAAHDGHISCLQLLEAKFGNDMVNHQARDGSTPLYYACKNNHVDCVQHLISKHADVNCKFSNNYLPLHLAAQKGFLTIANILLDNNAQIHINDTPENGMSPLLMAVKQGHLSIVQLLLSHHAEINYFCKYRLINTPLEEAINNNDITMIKLLLSYGANESLLSHLADLKLIRLYLNNDIDHYQS